MKKLLGSKYGKTPKSFFYDDGGKVSRWRVKLVQLIKVIEDVFNKPPIKFEPEKQSLKAWAVYCLRDRGFKVVYAQNADFAIERSGENIYFKVTNSAVDLDGAFGWLVWESSTNKVKVIAPQPN